MINTISILGCGWLGLPLGAFLVKKGYVVKGSTTNINKIPILQKNGIQPFLVNFNPLFTGNTEFFKSDLLIINIPPKVWYNPVFYHSNQIMNIRDRMLEEKIKYCIYISSTSVYPENNRVNNEDEKLPQVTKSQITLLAAENILRSHKTYNSIILRCGGLMGYDRVPIKYLEMSLQRGKNPNTPVNYVHRDDVINIISRLILKNEWNHTFNVVAPVHPLRKDFFPETQIINPEQQTISSYKIVSPKKIVNFLNYEFQFPNPVKFK